MTRLSWQYWIPILWVQSPCDTSYTCQQPGAQKTWYGQPKETRMKYEWGFELRMITTFWASDDTGGGWLQSLNPAILPPFCSGPLSHSCSDTTASSRVFFTEANQCNPSNSVSCPVTCRHEHFIHRLGTRKNSHPQARDCRT